ncbi:MAG TPA: nuclear transport factor 2 family protein [Polyangiaceae bacterium]|jgi:ketosteroid isomerase-like protein|nr:nuclear transport factor 2 family protein [Polyangiaceae bacterium]
MAQAQLHRVKQQENSGSAPTTSEATARLVRRYFAAFQAGDRSAFEASLADDFTFTSPYDDHIDRAAFFERCWPNHDKIKAFDLKVMTDGGEAFIVYDLIPKSGPPYRNVEHHVFEGQKLKSVAVYFGDPPADVPRRKFAAFLGAAVKAWKNGAFDA